MQKSTVTNELMWFLLSMSDVPLYKL